MCFFFSLLTGQITYCFSQNFSPVQKHICISVICRYALDRRSFDCCTWSPSTRFHIKHFLNCKTVAALAKSLNVIEPSHWESFREVRSHWLIKQAITRAEFIFTKSTIKTCLRYPYTDQFLMHNQNQSASYLNA